jgi:5-deoxy-glucuronate isomerase
MMHKDTGVSDQFEGVCSVANMEVKRFRVRKVRQVEGLKAEGSESILIPLGGPLNVSVGGTGEKFELDDKDTCYLSVGSEFSFRAKGPVDVLWAAAPGKNVYPSYVKRFSGIKVIQSGEPPYQRRVMTAVGEGDPANRFIAGFVEGDSGNWTSFPPHKHDGKPEVYVYYGLGKKFGVQLVLAAEDEKAFVVRDGDAVAFEKGYHPNVATPTIGMNFVWIISADPKARNLSVDVHPEFQDVPMGQTHLTVK